VISVQFFIFESISIVTGPSFISATFCHMPNYPVCTFYPLQFHLSNEFSYNSKGLGLAGFDIRWSVSLQVWSVNCETIG
jgi:hypothetical protein